MKVIYRDGVKYVNSLLVYYLYINIKIKYIISS